LLKDAVRNLSRPILDLGCGDGSFGQLICDRVDVGVDGAPDAVERCDPDVYDEVHPADMRAGLPVESASLGAVFSNSTLEHVEPVAPALAGVADALRPGGRLIFTVPTERFTRVVADQFGSQYAHRLNRSLGHRNLWSWSRWEEELTRAGLRVEDIRGYQSDAASIWYANRSLFPWTLLAGRAEDWLWRHDEDSVRRLVEDSLAVRAESESSCALITALRPASQS
jgi:SAM-dependent methyltransferase